MVAQRLQYCGPASNPVPPQTYANSTEQHLFLNTAPSRLRNKTLIKCAFRVHKIFIDKTIYDTNNL
jgi:hypothetical protein